MREVIDLILEFLLSVVVFIGCGFLLYKGIATELASGMITLVAGYWFQKRSNESAVNNLLRQAPNLSNPATPNTTQNNNDLSGGK